MVVSPLLGFLRGRDRYSQAHARPPAWHRLDIDGAAQTRDLLAHAEEAEPRIRAASEVLYVEARARVLHVDLEVLLPLLQLDAGRGSLRVLEDVREELPHGAKEQCRRRLVERRVVPVVGDLDTDAGAFLDVLAEPGKGRL